MSKAYITKHTPGKPNQDFIVTLPEFGEKDFYREVSSCNWFMTREAKRAWGDEPPKAFSITYCGVSYEARLNEPVMKKAQKVTGMFEFYKLARYDYKKQKYT